MHPHTQAIAILQSARDALAERLTQRIIESQRDIEEDAEGGTYFSEIEAIYDQLGGRLAHLNAMLANLPPTPPQPVAEATASEIVYADLAASPASTLDVDVSAPITVLGLPAPMIVDEPQPEPMIELFAGIVLYAQAGDLTAAARLICEVFDVKPSLARRGAQAFERQLQRYPDLGRRFEQLGAALIDTNEYAAATLLGECFGFQPIDALLLARALKRQHDGDTADEERGGSSG